MTKIIRQNYYTSTGEKKVNCYHITLNKDIMNRLNWDENTKIVIKIINNKVIIEKV